MSTAGPGPDPRPDDGEQTLALWREARAWWAGEPYIQIRTYVDRRGIRQVQERSAPGLGEPKPSAPAPPEDLTMDYADPRLRVNVRKIRDEKVAHACGTLPPSHYDRALRERQEEIGGTVTEPAPRPRALGKELREWTDEGHNGDPWRRTFGRSDTGGPTYAPLHVLSGYGFGRSVLLPEEIAEQAKQYGLPAVAIADPHSLMGVMEFARACREHGIQPLIGVSMAVPDGGEIVLIAKSKRGYVSLSHLVTACHLEEPRNFAMATWERLARHSADLLCLTGGDVGPIDRRLVRGDRGGARRLVEWLASVYGPSNVFLEIERSYLPWSRSVERSLLEFAEATGAVPVAGGAITHARRGDFPAQDVLLCAESLCLIEEVLGRKPRRHPDQPQMPPYPERSLNAERFLRSGAEMAALYADRPELLANTLRVAERCDVDVMPGRARLPSLTLDDPAALGELVRSQARRVYGVAAERGEHRRRLEMEIGRIQAQGYASHFLIAADACRWAREQGVGVSGRGSVVDSAVAYVLGLSLIDAIEHNLHFDRFLPADASKRADIDLDFEARRRDDVRAYMVRKYGLDRVAGLAAVGAYRARGVVRDVGKVMGLPEETIGFLAKRIHGGVSAANLEAALDRRPELRNSGISREKYRWIFALSQRLMDVPTGVGLHSSGVIVSESPIADYVPVMWSAADPPAVEGSADPHFRMIQWDKRSSKRVFDKFDLLCLRGQDVLGGTESRLRVSGSKSSLGDLEATRDPEVYRAMRSGELIGIPQSASPAMRQAHQRLLTDNLHDASLVQAGIRPGVGGAVKINELIARRRGKPFAYEHDKLQEILGNTYGLIVFQEQVDQLLETFCGYTASAAEDLRDEIYKRRKEEFAEAKRVEIIGKAIANGYSPEVAEHVYDLVSQFRGYGFAQGHALAFAEVSLRAVWYMQNHPAEYFAALLSAQPAGYYGPCTIANEARSRGLPILPLDVNRSAERFEAEATHDPITGLAIPNGGIRTGLMQLSGLSETTRERLLHQRRSRPFTSIFDFAARVQPPRDELESLVLCGAFDSLHPNRRALLWSLRAAQEHMRYAAGDGVLPLEFPEPPIDLDVADFTAQEYAVHERTLLDMDIHQHLMAFERDRIVMKGGVTAQEARRLPTGTKAMVVGNPIRLRFPPTASGKRVVFWDLEDETGLLNCTAFDDVYQQYGEAIVCSQYVTVLGTVQDRDGHAAFLVRKVFPYRPTLLRGVNLPVGMADFLSG